MKSIFFTALCFSGGMASVETMPVIDATAKTIPAASCFYRSEIFSVGSARADDNFSVGSAGVDDNGSYVCCPPTDSLQFPYWVGYSGNAVVNPLVHCDSFNKLKAFQ